MKLAAGTHLGRYEILAEIGRGGMGAVYRARDPKIERLVAIKTISLFGQEPDDIREYRERFVLEARAAGRLSHPGIVTIFDVGEEPENHDPYIVMEYVNGESLRKLLSAENKKIPVKYALQLVEELAQALHYAHSQGVIHRDIKPSNVLVTSGWHAKIADFGIAKLNLAQLTVPGQLLGSPAYMSPEQLSGEGVDSRSDLFSLGVILYTMITGYRPFQGNSATTVCFKVVNRDPIPVTSFDADLPPELDEIIKRAMAKDPGERFQTGAQMAEVIGKFRESYTFSEKSRLTVQTPGKEGLPGALKTMSFSRSTKRSARPVPEKTDSRRKIEERIYLAGCIVLLWLASFVLYGGLASVRRSTIGTTVAPAANSTSKHKNTMKELLSVADDPASEKTAEPGTSAKVERTKGTSVDALPSIVQIEVEHPFPKAELTVWLDNRAIYGHSLQGDTVKRALVFREVRGQYSDHVQVPSGQHQIHVRVHTADHSYDQSKTISAVLSPQRPTVLQILCDKRSDDLTLSLR